VPWPTTSAEPELEPVKSPGDDASRKILVGFVDASIEDGDTTRARAVGAVPRLGRLDADHAPLGGKLPVIVAF
jgi:hypothetical protein